MKPTSHITPLFLRHGVLGGWGLLFEGGEMRTKTKRITVLATLSSVFFLSSIAWAVSCPIPDTGQTKCYDNDSEITCPDPGEPFYGQDAQHPCNPQSYTSLAGGIMVQDNVTGLVWENKTDDGSIHDKDNTYNWQDAQDVFIAALNNDNFGGYSDWRLPTINELSFIRNLDTYDPSINTDYFPNTMVSSDYWSSTTYAGDPSYAWLVDFYDGDVLHYGKSYNYVRAVRSGQCGPFDNFIDNGDGTVTNTDTGLMWEVKTDDGGNRDKDNTYTWEEALSYCDTLTLASHNDWRLPNANELQSIVDYSTYDPSINTTFFPDTVSPTYIPIPSSPYWSSTTNADYPGYAGDPSYAWLVDFYAGDVYGGRKSYYSYVRAVRGGHCGSLDTSTTTTVASTTTTISGSTTSTISGSTTTTVEPCPTETLYGEHSEEAELLRYFRDNVLSQTPEGRELIKLYYELSASIVKAMEEDEEFKAQVKEMIDGVLPLIK